MITCLCNENHWTPHYYIVKLGFTRVYFYFLMFALTHRSRALVRTASVRRFWREPTIYMSIWAKLRKISHFNPKITIFTAMKYCSILHGHICVMQNKISSSFVIIYYRSPTAKCVLWLKMCKDHITILAHFYYRSQWAYQIIPFVSDIYMFVITGWLRSFGVFFCRGPVLV